MNPPDDPRFLAAVQLLERTGAHDFRIGYSDPDDGEPIVWYAVATWQRITAGPTVHRAAEAAGSVDPVLAVFRLCEQVIDGGQCMHCGRPTIFDATPSDTLADDMLDVMGCRYAYDPERSTFRRDCEGDAP